MRLIDADKLLRDIEHYNLSDGKFQHWIEIQPSAEPERKKGTWTVYTDCEGKGRRITCDQCGYEEWNWCNLNFCPNCGADMREGEEE